jgi:hypothetical protein
LRAVLGEYERQLCNEAGQQRLVIPSGPRDGQFKVWLAPVSGVAGDLDSKRERMLFHVIP